MSLAAGEGARLAFARLEDRWTAPRACPFTPIRLLEPPLLTETVIDTEAGRAKHYADLFSFDHADLRPPFTPDAYREAIETADKAARLSR